MSDTYLQMWNDIKEYVKTPKQLDAWINFLAPATGRHVRFGTGSYLDVDLLEALRNWRVDLLREWAAQDPALAKITFRTPQEVIQMLMDEGMILDQRQPNFD